MKVTIKDRAMIEAIKDIIEPFRELPKGHGRERVEAMRRQHLARSKAARILNLIREADNE